MSAGVDAPARVLVITADDRVAERAARIGAYAHLRKPFDIGELVVLVRRGLER